MRAGAGCSCVGRGGDVDGVGRGVQQYARRKGSVVVGCQVIPVSETSRQLHIRPASEVRQSWTLFCKFCVVNEFGVMLRYFDAVDL